MAGGLAFVRRQRGLGALVGLAAAVNVLGAPVFVMLPFFAGDTLGAGAGLYGLMIAAFGGGGIAGYVLAARAGADARGRPRVLLSTLVVIAACMTLLAFAPGPVAALLLLAVAGGCNGYFGVRTVSIIQLRTPDEMRGRVFGLLQTLAMGLAPVAMLATGLVADAAGLDARAVFLSCGLALVAVTVAGWGRPSLREYLGGRAPRE
jgi:MFS family permease